MTKCNFSLYNNFIMNAKIDVTDIVIETERLILRAFEPTDLEDFFEYARVPGVGERAGWPHHESIDVSKRILSNFIKEKKTLAIVLKENNKVIGSIGIEPYKLEEKLSEFFNYEGREIGYVLSKDYWGRGIMPEGVKAVIHYLFNELNYDFLICGYYDFNSQSRSVQLKCGFKPYRKLVYKTALGENQPGVMSFLVNPNKIIKFEFSHPETLIYEEEK